MPKTISIDFWESYLYREVWLVTKLSPAGEIMKAKCTNTYIHVDDIDKIPAGKREMLQFISISTSKLKTSPIELVLYEEV